MEQAAPEILGTVMRLVARAVAAGGLAAVVWLVPALASADAGGDAEVSARLAFVTTVLEREAPRARAWDAGWTFGFAGLALVQGGLALAASDDTVRMTAIVGGLKSALGFGVRLALPLSATTAVEVLRHAAERTPSERWSKLRLAESLLQRSAREERWGRSWVPLVLGAVLNLTVTTIVWSVAHRPVAGWLGLGSGMAISGFMLWTQPTGAMKAWEAYTRGARVAEPASSWSVVPWENGGAVTVSF